MPTENKHYLSKERLEALESELKELKNNKRREIAERLKTAKEFGDLSENSEYAEAREDQAKVESRIFEIEEILKQFSIFEEGDSADFVKVGSSVTVKTDSKSSTYTIVGSNEADPSNGKISNESPLGEALLGRKVGDKISVRTPGGEVSYLIAKIG